MYSQFLCLLVAVAVVQGLLQQPAGQSTRAGKMGLQMSGVERNENFGKLQAGYLFPEIGRRRNAYLEANPDAKLISLGIGDTTQPIPKHILSGLVGAASKLGSAAGYSGYGAEQGMGPLREKIATKLYNNLIQPGEVCMCLCVYVQRTSHRISHLINRMYRINRSNRINRICPLCRSSSLTERSATSLACS
jgi:hypothetical protein